MTIPEKIIGKILGDKVSKSKKKIIERICPHCHGSGFDVDMQLCDVCEGKGRLYEEE